MAITALTTFIQIKDAAGKLQHKFQNSKPGQLIVHRGMRFPYLSFIYQGAAKNRTGDNLESQLVLSSNAVSMSYAVEAVQNRWQVIVDSCSMHPVDFTVGRILTTEYWLAASIGYDPEVVEVLLSSGIDAVGSNAPNRVLTTNLVGALPTSAAIYNR